MELLVYKWQVLNKKILYIYELVLEDITFDVTGARPMPFDLSHNAIAYFVFT